MEAPILALETIMKKVILEYLEKETILNVTDDQHQCISFDKPYIPTSKYRDYLRDISQELAETIREAVTTKLLFDFEKVKLEANIKIIDVLFKNEDSNLPDSQ